MFAKKPMPATTELDRIIESLCAKMHNENPASEQYSKMADQLVKLYSLKDTTSLSRITPDTLAVVLGNLAGIIVIVGHERANVITSKALLFLQKLR